MIQDEVRHVQSQLNEEDVPVDSLSRLRDRLVRYGDTQSDSEMMHVVHQLILIPSWMTDALYSDLETRATDSLSQINSNNEDQEVGNQDLQDENIPLEIKLIERELNKKGVKSLFDTDYGQVQQSSVMRLVADALDLDDPDPSDDTFQQLSTLLTNILQDEIDSIEKEYEKEINSIYEEIIEVVDQSENPVTETRRVLEKYNQKWHTRAQGWPGEPAE